MRQVQFWFHRRIFLFILAEFNFVMVLSLITVLNCVIYIFINEIYKKKSFSVKVLTIFWSRNFVFSVSVRWFSFKTEPTLSLLNSQRK